MGTYIDYLLSWVSSVQYRTHPVLVKVCNISISPRQHRHQCTNGPSCVNKLTIFDVRTLYSFINGSARVLYRAPFVFLRNWHTIARTWRMPLLGQLFEQQIILRIYRVRIWYLQKHLSKHVHHSFLVSTGFW